MRLLDTTSFEQREFFDNIPPYAILSHTWGEEEVTFRDLPKETRTSMKGWQKVENCCKQAAEDGWRWVWIDTCCIDKSDSTELGEAINSMFRWYEDAQVCYAYLEDVPTWTAAHPAKYSDALRVGQGFPWKWYVRRSRWFTRGWTLQELLAPSYLLFLDTSWEIIGPREMWADEICAATGLYPKDLLGFRACSIATKLSWAVKRQTTREEDRAYSLLGLLGVSMPLIYGEGKKAFIRLQQELIRNYNDESILAWGQSEDHKMKPVSKAPTGVLANSVDGFAGSRLMTWPFDSQRRGFTVSNMGVTLNAEVFEGINEYDMDKPPEIFSIQLNCTWSWHSRRRPAQLFLLKTGSSMTSLSFRRFTREVRPWPDTRTASVWRSIGRHDIIIEHVEDEASPNLAMMVVITDIENAPVSIGPPLKYFFDDSFRAWMPAIDEVGVVKDMTGQHVLWISNCEVLITRSGALLTDIWVNIDAIDIESLSDYQRRLPNPILTSQRPRVRRAQRFGLIAMSTSSSLTFGIWPMEPQTALGQLCEKLGSSPPYPLEAPLDLGIPEPLVGQTQPGLTLQLSWKPMPPPGEIQSSTSLRTTVGAVVGAKHTDLSHYFKANVTKKFCLRLSYLRNFGDAREAFQVEGFGTVPFAVPCPVIVD